MRNRFDSQLEKLNKELIEMGAMCEDAINLTAEALIEGDKEIAKKVIPVDSDIDRMEGVIESLCLRLLLQQQPVARDLRQISAALKIITDMERIGDQAADIAEIVEEMASPGAGQLESISAMAKAAASMVTESVDAYVKRDVEIAQKVIAHDDVVDEYFEKVRKVLIQLISENSEIGQPALDTLMIAKYFERIGDHAVNIAEWVVFSVTGIHVGGED